MRNVTALGELEPVWSNFLTAHNGIFTVLEQGAKINPKSRQWFGEKKTFRRKDEMLNYLHQARNADEHDIPSVVAQRFAGGISFPDKQPSGMKITRVTFRPAGSNIETVVENHHGLKDVTVLSPVFVLCRVHDNRSKRYFDVPTTHLGKPIEASRAIGVAELANAYTSDLLVEAEKLAL